VDRGKGDSTGDDERRWNRFELETRHPRAYVPLHCCNATSTAITSLTSHLDLSITNPGNYRLVPYFNSFYVPKSTDEG